MVGDNVYWHGQAFQIVSPMLEIFEDSWQLFVMNVIVEFSSGKGLEVECYWMQHSV